MADTKISALTTDSAPDRAADYSPTYDASAVATKKVLLSDYGPLTREFSCALFNPADATTYFVSNRPGVTPGTSIAGFKLFIARTGKIAQAYIQFSSSVGTSETSTVSIRLNDSTDTAITASVDLSASPAQYSNTGLSIAVTAGDYVTIKWLTPTWATNPTLVDISGFLHII